mgnify:CR=1 FL=1
MFRSNNYKIMSNYLLSIPDVISVYEAADTVGTWFAYVEKSFYKFAVKNKPKYILENYICFHKDLKYGVYQDEGRFYFVSIMKPKYFLGFQWYMFTIQVVSEILTDSPNWISLYKNMPVKRVVKDAIRGHTWLRIKTNSEKSFFQAIIDYETGVNDLIAKEEAAKLEKEREEARKRKAEEERRARKRKAEEERRAEEERQKKIALLKDKYGENIAKEFEAGRIAIGMPISYVEDIWGSGHDRKRNVSKDGEIIKEKFGKYHKKDGRTGKKSSKTYFKLEVEFERNEKGNSWLVTGFRDL